MQAGSAGGIFCQENKSFTVYNAPVGHEDQEPQNWMSRLTMSVPATAKI